MIRVTQVCPELALRSWQLLSDREPRATRAGHPWLVCLVYIGLDRKPEAMRWLKRAHDEGDFSFDLDNPVVDPLRSSPEFQELEGQVKGAQSGQTAKCAWLPAC